MQIKRKTLFVIGALAGFIFIALGLASAHPSLKTKPTEGAVLSPSAPMPNTQNISNSLTAQGRVEAERITIRPTGFEPAEVVRPAGRFILAIDNQSGVGDVTLHLDHENGGRVQDIPLTGGARYWRKVINLSPGVYILSEANHADWSCRITINS